MLNNIQKNLFNNINKYLLLSVCTTVSFGESLMSNSEGRTKCVSKQSNR